MSCATAYFVLHPRKTVESPGKVSKGMTMPPDSDKSLTGCAAACVGVRPWLVGWWAGTMCARGIHVSFLGGIDGVTFATDLLGFRKQEPQPEAPRCCPPDTTPSVETANRTRFPVHFSVSAPRADCCRDVVCGMPICTISSARSSADSRTLAFCPRRSVS